MKWLLATRKEYIRCYYLHLAVVDSCINNWGKTRAVVVPGTEPYLRDVLGFLRNNAESIRQIIFS